MCFQYKLQIIKYQQLVSDLGFNKIPKDYKGYRRNL